MSTALADRPNRTEPLSTLADQINDHHRKAESAIRSGLDHALEAGRLLIEAKGQCEHGTWGDWLQVKFEGSQRTAQAYMRVAKHRPQIEAERNGVALLSFRDAVKLLATPRPDEPAASDVSLPGEFAPGSGRCLTGSHLLYPMTVYVAESIEHPGYWHVLIIDWRPQNVINAGTVAGFCRPIIARYLAEGFRDVLKRECLDPGQFEWRVAADKTAVQGIRKHCEDEAEALWATKNYWWRQGRGQN